MPLGAGLRRFNTDRAVTPQVGGAMSRDLPLPLSIQQLFIMAHNTKTLTYPVALAPLLSLPCTPWHLLRRLPHGRWGIDQDPLSDNDQWVHWSGYVYRAFYADGEPLPIDDHDVFTDGMMVTAAMEAFLDMENAMTDEAAIPRAMTVLQATMPNTRGELFFSSAIRRNGVGFRIQFPTSCASRALDRCSAINSDLVTGQEAQNIGEIHRTGGNCGEPGAVHLFCRQHENYPIEKGLPAGSRIVTVGRAKRTRDLVIFNPCGLDNIDLEEPVPAWGCERFLNDVNIPAIPSTTTPIPIAAAWRFDYSYTCL